MKIKHPILYMGIGLVIAGLGLALLPSVDTFVTNTPGAVGWTMIVVGLGIFFGIIILGWGKKRQN